MGIYLNPSADGFASIMKTGDYVDKTGLIIYMNAVLNSSTGGDKRERERVVQ